ncbi:hypothetical protein [Rubritalea tangerina]|uniref:DUF4440 domain-containing protein n=1 Tax=Rubritalea tangerina TaxID=430798 RepID=A0ABW4ZCI3_9BACT
MKLFRILSIAALALGALTLGTSCSSTVGIGNSSNAFVSTEINNSSRSKVNSAIKSVFQEEGFALISQGANDYRFQKWGGTSTEVIYGSWFTDGVAIEPEVEIVTLGNNNYVVLCDVYMREHSGSSLDANWRLMGSGKIAYNGLMKKIKKRAEAK